MPLESWAGDDCDLAGFALSSTEQAAAFQQKNKFIPGMRVDAVCLHLQALIEDRNKDLIINIPPSFAKSMIGAVFFPAWVWIKRPEHRFLFSSYKAEYATNAATRKGWTAASSPIPWASHHAAKPRAAFRYALLVWRLLT